MNNKTLSKVIWVFLIVATILQFALKLGGNKGIFRYGFMWFAVYARVMFSASLIGYPSLSHKAIEAVCFGMSLFMFFAFNSRNTDIFHPANIIIVIILEIIIFGFYKLNDSFIYIIKTRKM